MPRPFANQLTRIPTNNSPVIDSDTGLMNRDWFRFLSNMSPIGTGYYVPTILINGVPLDNSLIESSIGVWNRIGGNITVSGIIFWSNITADPAAVVCISVPNIPSLDSTFIRGTITSCVGVTLPPASSWLTIEGLTTGTVTYAAVISNPSSGFLSISDLNSTGGELGFFITYRTDDQ